MYYYGFLIGCRRIDCLARDRFGPLQFLLCARSMWPKHNGFENAVSSPVNNQSNFFCKKKTLNKAGKMSKTVKLTLMLSCGGLKLFFKKFKKN